MSNDCHDENAHSIVFIKEKEVFFADIAVGFIILDYECIFAHCNLLGKLDLIFFGSKIIFLIN